MGNDVIRFEDLRKAADDIAARADDAFGDATRKEKYLALKGPESTALVPFKPALPAAVEKKKPERDTRAQTVNALTAGLQRLRAEGLLTPESTPKQRQKIIGMISTGLERMNNARKAIEKEEVKEAKISKGGQKDSKGVLLRDGRAYWNGNVVKPGGVYHPKGLLGGKKRNTFFICKSIEWMGDRLIAVGELKVEVDTLGDLPMVGIFAPSKTASSQNRWYYVTDLAASDFLQ
jgi:hypothetical protein